MYAIAQLVTKNGYSMVFAAMFAHQIGVPLPGPLFLLAAGALVAAGELGLIPTLGLAVIGCVLADWVWYEAGRRRGDKVLHFIHRLTRDPDAHDRRAKATFARYGHRLLVFAKFVPGLDGVAPPLAGTSRTSRLRFLAFDAVGAGVYSCVYGGLGYVFSHDLDRACELARANLDGRELVVDLKNLVAISEDGENVLLALMNNGVKLRSNGVFTKHLLRQLARRLRKGLQGRKT